MRSDLIQRARRVASPHSEAIIPPLLRMPGEVLDLISDFIMDINPYLHQNLDPRQLDLYLYEKSHSFQSLRYTCRQLVPPRSPLPNNPPLHHQISVK